MVESVLCVALGISSVVDIHRKEIPVVVLFIAAIWISVVLYLQGELQYGRMLGVFAIWGIFTMISLLTKGRLGVGDGMLFALVGLAMGIQSNIAIIMLCFLFAFVLAVGMIALRKATRQTQMPLAPLVFVSTIVFLVLQQTA
ncbi:MAG: prepilin peptidase [Lachnospiraceae bacterium]|nr:prepilin peptidase [Lachnospiraceae bacterium]